MKAKTSDPAEFDRDFDELLETASPAIARIARRLVKLLTTQHPELGPIVRKGWRSVNFRHPKAGFVCGIFPQANDVLLVFEHGRLLDNSSGLLEGDYLKKVRFIRFRPRDAVPAGHIGALVFEAISLRV
jgi:Domain of unknown function (DU1801)